MTLFSWMLLGLALAAFASAQCVQDDTFQCLVHSGSYGAENYCLAVLNGRMTDLEIPVCLVRTTPCASGTAVGYVYGTPGAPQPLCIATPAPSEASSACSCAMAAGIPCTGTGQPPQPSTSLRWWNTSSTASVTASVIQTLTESTSAITLSTQISGSLAGSGVVGTPLSQPESRSTSLSSITVGLNGTSSSPAGSVSGTLVVGGSASTITQALTSVLSEVISVVSSHQIVISVGGTTISGNSPVDTSLPAGLSGGNASSPTASSSLSTVTSATTLSASESVVGSLVLISSTTSTSASNTSFSGGGPRPGGNQTTSSASLLASGSGVGGSAVTSTITSVSGTKVIIIVIVITNGVTVTLSSSVVTSTFGTFTNGSLSQSALATTVPADGLTISASGIIVSSGFVSVSQVVSSVAASIVISEIVSNGVTVTVSSTIAVGGGVVTNIGVSGTATTLTTAGAVSTVTGGGNGIGIGNGTASSSKTDTISTGTLTSSGFKTAYTISPAGMLDVGACYSPNPPIASLPQEWLDNFNVHPGDTYLDSVRMSLDGTNPLYGTFIVPITVNGIVTPAGFTMDFTDLSKFVLIDSNLDSMVITANSITFSTAGCGCGFRISIANFFTDTIRLLNLTCTYTPRPLLKARLDETHFAVYANITDQCGEPAAGKANMTMSVGVGSTPCTNAGVDAQGQDVWGCAFPGVNSAVMVCQRNAFALLTWLFETGVANGCPTIAQLIQAVFGQLQGFITPATVLQTLQTQTGYSNSSCALRAAAFSQAVPELLEAAEALFKPTPGTNGSASSSALQAYVNNYNASNGGLVGAQAVVSSICQSTDSTTFPEALWLRYGLTNVTIEQLYAAPASPVNFSGSIVDPAQRSCCSPASRCQTDPDGTKYYDDPAFYNSTDPDDACICGTSAEGQGIGFRSFRCASYKECAATTDCAAGQTCLAFSCCKNNVCVTNNECNQPGMGKRSLLGGGSGWGSEMWSGGIL